MSSETNRIIWDLQITGAQKAKSDLNATTQAFREGKATITDVDLALQKLDTANSKVAGSITRVGNSFRSAHPNVATFERALARVGTLVSSVKSAFDSINLLTLALGDKSAETARIEQDLLNVEKELALARDEAIPNVIRINLLEQDRNRLLAELDRAAETEAQNQQRAVTNMIAVGAQLGIVATQGLLALIMSDKLKGATKLLGSVLSRVGGVAGLLGGAIIGAGIAMGFIFTKTVNLQEKMGIGNVTIEAAREAWKSLPGPLGELAAQLTVLSDQISINLLPFTMAFEKSIADTGALIAQGFKGFQEHINQFATGAADRISAWGSNVLAGIKVWGAAFGAIIGNAIKTALNIMIDLLNLGIKTVNASINAFNSILPPGFPKVGTFKEIPRLQQGVEDFRGGLALIGEGGPEILNLPKGSNVIPNNKIGGTTFNVFVAGNVITERELARSLSEMLSEETNSVF
ncbi:MAG: hypothetical protein V3T99_00060 [Nitrososphaerales archaeon]